MKNKLIIITIIIILLFTLISCTNIKMTSYESLEFFGTTTYLVLGGDFNDKTEKEKADKVWNDVKDVLRDLDNQISENIETSDIAKFNKANAGEKIEIGFYTYDLLTKCKEFYNATNGKFNPAVAHLIDLWGFTPRFTDVNFTKLMPYDRDDYKTQLPNSNYIDGFIKLLNFNDIILSKEDKSYFIEKPNNKAVINGTEYTMKISLGGIGKGYGTDIANKIIKESFKDGYLSIGGSSMALNQNPNSIKNHNLDWRVGIGHPRKIGERYMNIFVSDLYLSTSGDYERYYEINGDRYCHIINNDGYPIKTNMVTSTIVGKSSAMCDALTTAICCMSLEEANEFLNSDYVIDNDLRVYFVYNNNNNYELHTNSDCELVENSYKIIK